MGPNQKSELSAVKDHIKETLSKFRHKNYLQHTKDMSFLFNWKQLRSLNIKDEINLILSTISLPELPKNSKLMIKELSFGDSCPNFELLEIVELDMNKFKGLFKFRYEGELNLVLNSKFEINTIRLINFDSFTRPNFILSDKSTIIPVDLNIKNLKIDGILTVVYYNGKITVVFRDEPMIDLELNTSIDELLDDELFDEIKTTVLDKLIEGVKQDLPEYIHSLSLNDEQEETENASKELATIVPNDSSISDISIHNSDLVQNNSSMSEMFNTLSLKASGLPDVYQRVCLGEYNGMEYLDHYKGLKEMNVTRKRRVVKMGKTRKSKRKQEMEAQHVIKEEEAELAMKEVAKAHGDEADNNSVKSSNSTLINDAESNDLTTITLNSDNNDILNHFLNYEYKNMIEKETQDLLPFDLSTGANGVHEMSEVGATNLTSKLNIKQNSKKSRNSSNYINLNTDFIEFNRKFGPGPTVSTTNNEKKDLITTSVFYD